MGIAGVIRVGGEAPDRTRGAGRRNADFRGTEPARSSRPRERGGACAAMRRIAGLCAVVGSLLAGFAPPRASAAVHALRPGATIASLGVEIKPGDEIVLEPGRHGPIEIDGLRGERGRPIVIRGSNPNVPAAIAGEEFGILVRGGSHLLVKDVIVIGGSRAAVIVEPAPATESAGGAPTEHLTLRRVAVGRTGAEGVAMALRGARDVSIEQCRTDRAGAASIVLDHCADVRILDAALVGGADPAQPTGIVIGGGSRKVLIAGLRVQGGIETGIAVGVPLPKMAPAPDATAKPTTDPAAEATTGSGAAASPVAPAPGDAAAPTSGDSVPARRGDADPLSGAEAPPNGSLGAAPPPQDFAAADVTIEQSVLRRCGPSISIGSVDGLVITRSTFAAPRGSFLLFPALPGSARPARGVLLAENLFVWLPNEIRRLAEMAPERDLAGVSLGRNLWWSEELSHVGDALGPFPGRESAAQTTTIDPKLGDFDLATNPEAAGFGAGN